MNTATKGLFRTTIGRKNMMALTGLFLSFFLIIHLAGNLALFAPEPFARETFNGYSHFLGSLFIIELISYVLYASILIHAIDGVVLTIQNLKAAGTKYVRKDRSSSPWYSRNMLVLGSIIFVFLIIHLINFWSRYKLGMGAELSAYELKNGEQVKDLYQLVTSSFKDPILVVFYVISMVVLAFHLVHGVYSAFRSLGFYQNRWVRGMKLMGVGFAIIISAAFAIIPIFVYFFR